MSVISRPKALKELLIFAIPIILGQVGMMLIGTGDMIIAGRYSREALAAIGLAVSICNPLMIPLLGLQFSISPILAQKRGQGENVEKYFWTIIFYSVAVSLISSLLVYLSLFILPYFGYAENTTRLIHEYILITSASTVGFYIYYGVKEFYQSEEKTFFANAVALAAVVVNLIFNYAFVFGKWGIPQLYEAGLAWASLGCRCFMGIGLFLMAHKLWKTPKAIQWDFLKEVIKVGTPLCFSIFFEVMAFCSVTLFVGKFDEIQVAANNLALNIGSLAFMIPMSIASAVAVKVGHAYGERKFDRIRIFSQVSLFSSVCFTALMGLTFYLFPHMVMSLYIEDPAVIGWGKTLLFWVACFQLFDGAQVTMGGILRGLSITRAPSIAIFIGYWVIGIPLGYYLGFHAGLESQGFWIGLAISLALVAVMLGVIMKKKLKALN